MEGGVRDAVVRQSLEVDVLTLWFRRLVIELLSAGLPHKPPRWPSATRISDHFGY